MNAWRQLRDQYDVRFKKMLSRADDATKALQFYFGTQTFSIQS